MALSHNDTSLWGHRRALKFFSQSVCFSRRRGCRFLRNDNLMSQVEISASLVEQTNFLDFLANFDRMAECYNNIHMLKLEKYKHI